MINVKFLSLSQMSEQCFQIFFNHFQQVVRNFLFGYDLTSSCSNQLAHPRVALEYKVPPARISNSLKARKNLFSDCRRPVRAGLSKNRNTEGERPAPQILTICVS